MTYLQITLDVPSAGRDAAVATYVKYRQAFLTTVDGARSKQLLVRDDDVQVLHEFVDADAAKAYLQSDLFTVDIVAELGPLLASDPDVRIYDIRS